MIEAGALSGLRVPDLSDYRAQLCGRLLADMGADVIKVEPPGGDAARRNGPFVDDAPPPDRSLFFWFYTLNRRAMTLDITQRQGTQILLKLAKSADLVIESSRPLRMSGLGAGWEALHQVNPSLILLSMAPFGQSGPYCDFEADDTVLT